MLRTFSPVVGLALLALSFFTELAYARDVSVRGYTRKDGTYVAPHHRSSPDGNFYNNWSTVGNVNPYTGQAGTLTSPSHGGYTSAPASTPGYAPRPGMFLRQDLFPRPDMNRSPKL